MRGIAFIALFGFAAALSGALSGCSDDDDEAEAKPPTTRKGTEGDSCTRTDDCDANLACISNVCQESGSSTGGSGGSNSTGGSTGKGGSTGSLGQEGESCTRRADCAQNLGCYNQRCAAMPTGEGGAGPTVTQGERGETCVLSSDCVSPLVCLPKNTDAAIGVCTDRDSGVTATGMTCGAECKTAADCCELPIEVHASLGTNVKSCADLADVLDGVDCDTATGQDAARCFANNVYCICTSRNVSTNWTCTDDGMCVYKAACSTDGLVPDGCATHSRSGVILTSTCDLDSERCVLATGSYCADDDECNDTAAPLMVTDDPTDTCNAGECICYQHSACYRRCSEDLDCARGKRCDTNLELCVPEDSCTDDLQCQARAGDIRAFCDAGTCNLECQHDLDCNAGGLTNPSNAPTGGPFQKVCGDDHVCVTLGCTDDTECPAAVNGVSKLFCTAHAPGTAAGAPSSAITD